MKKKEIVINVCFGGFSLSDEAFELYLKKKGVKYYKEPDRFGESDYYRVPKEKYERLSKKWYREDGDYRRMSNSGFLLQFRQI